MSRVMRVFLQICVMVVWCLTPLFSVMSVPVSAANGSYPNDVKILVHNVYMLPQSLYPNWGQVKRADLISEAAYIKSNDLIIFNELYDNEASTRLLGKIKNQYPYQTPVLGRGEDGWDSTQGSYSRFTPEDGGVSIVSKYPILEKIQHVYSKGCGTDWYANKGFAYVQMKKDNRIYHVIGTHMQSDDEGCSAGEAASIRKTQMSEMRQFIEKKKIPAEEVLFIGGDLNVIKGSSEYPSMINDLHVTEPTAYTGFSSTWDPTTNGITKYNYPNLAPQHLDYILVEKNHAKPQNWYVESLYAKSPEWSVTSWFKKYSYTDYSDHYPVTGFSKP
ncbi:sphingomyelin phosphodiesterase [Baia soyae]|uniref:Phospholipase C n=1 Tax=Baia soyae TaxID=1544746 RepID=A0A4R2RXG4_9BACL|nr:sphingomyelin phosphodiesterase [Baia soyae]TCP69205.1 phospholipase C [Baia soyae]